MEREEHLLCQMAKAQAELAILRAMCRDAAANGHDMSVGAVREMSEGLSSSSRDLLAAWKHLRELIDNARKMHAAPLPHRDGLMAAVDRLSGAGR